MVISCLILFNNGILSKHTSLRGRLEAALNCRFIYMSENLEIFHTPRVYMQTSQDAQKCVVRLARCLIYFTLECLICNIYKQVTRNCIMI